MNISSPTLQQLTQALSLQQTMETAPFHAIFQDCAIVPNAAVDMSPCLPVTVQAVKAPITENNPVQAETGMDPVQLPASRIQQKEHTSSEPRTPELANLLDALAELGTASGESVETQQQADISRPLENMEAPIKSPYCPIANTAITSTVQSPKVELPTESAIKTSGSAVSPVALPQSTKAARLPNSAREVALVTLGSTVMDINATAMTITSSFQAPTQTAAPSPMAEVLQQPEQPTLELFKDAQWLGTLARDITAGAASDGKLQFRLVPEFLGALDVGLVHDGGSVDVHVETTTDAAARIIAAEQPRLLEELRHAGLKLGTFDLNGGQQGGTQRQQQPAVPVAAHHSTKDQTPPKRDGRFA